MFWTLFNPGKFVVCVNAAGDDNFLRPGLTYQVAALKFGEHDNLNVVLVGSDLEYAWSRFKPLGENQPQSPIIMPPAFTANFRPSVFMVHTKTHGVPRLCAHIPDDHEVTLAGGEEFFSAFVSRLIFEPR